MLKDILQGRLIQLILVHLVDGMTGQDQSGFPGLPPPDELSEHIQCKIFEYLVHISSLSSALTPSVQNFWCHREEYGKHKRPVGNPLTPKICEPQKSRRKRGKSGAKSDKTGGRRRGINYQ
jgi:hypothetical protein